ncbi:unnamed protein product [Chrysoparadoxa australica]
MVAERDRHLEGIYSRRRKRTERDKSHLYESLKYIPTFYAERKVDAAGDSGLQAKLRLESRARFLQRKEQELMEFSDLTQLESLFKDENDPGNMRLLNYKEFLEIKERAPAAARPYFSATSFLLLPQDKKGRIDASVLFKHIYGSICLQKTKITLHYYDTEGQGYLREQDLENYIYDLIPTMPSLQSMPGNFAPFYVFTAVRRFMFFLDPKKSGRIDINTIVRSKAMDELMDLGMTGAGSGEEGDASDTELAKNWFSAENTLRVYSEYLELDTDQNGMLSRSELEQYIGSRQPLQLTPIFVERLFQEIITYKMTPDGTSEGKRVPGDTSEGEMDYKTFLDFVLAMENKQTVQALAYFWKILDVRHDGSLCSCYFYSDIVKKLAEGGFEAPNASDVKDEIWDMVKPEDGERITFQDLVRSGVGHTVVSILIDMNASCEPRELGEVEQEKP